MMNVWPSPQVKYSLLDQALLEDFLIALYKAENLYFAFNSIIRFVIY